MFVKICGTTSEDDALLAVAMGADAVGFVFAPSPRQVAVQVAADIIKRLPSEILTVGVFRDAAPLRILNQAHAAGVQAVQLHGHEPPEVAQWLHERVPYVIQGFPAGDARVRRAAEYQAYAVLLDAPSPGSGEVFDWSLASEVPPGQRVIIAGGLTSANVGAAISQTRPWGVDVVSGVEAAPGRKDAIKVREFIKAARDAADALQAFDAEGLPERRDEEGDADSMGLLYDWQEDS